MRSNRIHGHLRYLIWQIIQATALISSLILKASNRALHRHHTQRPHPHRALLLRHLPQAFRKHHTPHRRLQHVPSRWLSLCQAFRRRRRQHRHLLISLWVLYWMSQLQDILRRFEAELDVLTQRSFASRSTQHPRAQWQQSEEDFKRLHILQTLDGGTWSDAKGDLKLVVNRVVDAWENWPLLVIVLFQFSVSLESSVF